MTILKIKKLCRVLFSFDLLWLRALLKGVAPSIEHSDAIRNLDVKTVVDVGANRGQFALYALRMFPEAAIHSFEPLTAAIDDYRKIFRDESRVTLHPFAIGTKSSSKSLHVSAKDDSSSLLPIAEKQVHTFPGTQEVDSVEVEVRTLDQCLSEKDVCAPALLKIDVQGYELKVLEGSVDLLELFEWVYCECSFQELYTGQSLAYEIVGRLFNSGFVLSGVFNVSYDKDGQPVQADFLFRRTS